MTTNVRDSSSGILASDSRWTWEVQLPNGNLHTSFLDDTGYEKLLRGKGFIFMFAGDAYIIEQWKKPIKEQSYTASQVDWANLPVNGMAISVVQEGTGTVAYEFNHDIPLGVASFAGTGSYAAAKCWITNQCAKRAVETAKTTDQHTGGTVRYHNVRTGESNVGPDIELDVLIQQFTGGNTMAGDIKQTSTLGEVAARHDVAANDETAVRKAFLEAYAKGQGPTAPCDAVFTNWPTDEKAKLVKVMQQIFAS